jgi:hypothetical protein
MCVCDHAPIQSVTKRAQYLKEEKINVCVCVYVCVCVCVVCVYVCDKLDLCVSMKVSLWCCPLYVQAALDLPTLNALNAPHLGPHKNGSIVKRGLYQYFAISQIFLASL